MIIKKSHLQVEIDFLGKFSHQKRLTYIHMFAPVYAVMSRQMHPIFHKETKLIVILVSKWNKTVVWLICLLFL